MGSSYDDWTVQELKEALKERDLPVSGKKRELIDRLESNNMFIKVSIPELYPVVTFAVKKSKLRGSSGFT